MGRRSTPRVPRSLSAAALDQGGDDGLVGEGARVAEVRCLAGCDLPEDAPHDFAAAGLRQGWRELDSVGMPPHVLKEFDNQLAKPEGLLLITGPTGSGKTSTLYAGLRRINKPQLNVVTVEDPVEFDIPLNGDTLPIIT